MRTRGLVDWLRDYIYSYNTFIPDDDEYSEGTDELRDPAKAIKYQRYATRLYIPLLIGKSSRLHNNSLSPRVQILVTLYIMFFVALINPQSKTVSISNITPALFIQLRRDHSETLSCPCTNTIVPYEVFVSNTIEFDPVCSSAFISRQWIEALYVAYASALLVMDLRTTGSSQVSRSCSKKSFNDSIGV